MVSLISRKKKGKYKYYYLVISKRVNGKPRIVWQKYLGTAERLKQTLENTQIPDEVDTKEFGAIAALLSVNRQINFVDVINKHIPKRKQGLSVGDHILISLINRIIEPLSKNKLGDWYNTTILKQIYGVKTDYLSSQGFWNNYNCFDDNDWAAIKANIQKARQRWGQVAQILSRQGATSSTMAYFYKAVVQAVLLYASESWVLTERTIKALSSFHNRCARFISGDHIRQKPNGEWILPPTAEVLEKCKLRTVKEYIEKRRRTIRAFVEARPIYEACIASTPTDNNVNQKVWWKLQDS
jgi:hypothetical protein